MPTTYGSRLQDLAAEYRAALEARDRATSAILLRQWQEAQQRVRVEVAQLLSKMEAARLAGTPISPAWLYQERRLAQLTETIHGQVQRFIPYAEAEARTAARRAQDAALREAAGLSREAARQGLPGVEAGFTDINVENMTQVMAHTAPGGPLRGLLATIGEATVEGAINALQNGVLLGKGTDWIAREMGRVMDIPRHRAETIARTEALRVYRETSRLTFQASNVVGSWAWDAALDRRTCPACVVMHGTVHPLDQPLDGHPRCRCAMIPRTKTWGEVDPSLADLPDTRPPLVSGKAWLTGQPPSVQRAVMGPGKHDAWTRGDISLDDMVARTHSPEWGTMRRERSMVEIAQGRNPNTIPELDAPRLADTPADRWAHWETGRNQAVRRGSSDDVIRERSHLEWLEKDRDRYQGYLDQADEMVKTNLARLKSYVPDAAERRKAARSDYSLKTAKAFQKRAKADLARVEAEVAEAQAKLAGLQGDLPDFNPANPLEFYGDRLTIHDHSDSARRWLDDLETHVGQDHHTLLRDHFAEVDGAGIYVGGKYLPDLDDLGYLKGQAPRGWPPGSTFDQVAGAYVPNRRVLGCGHDIHGADAFHSTAVHEAGHALDDSYGTQGLLGGPASTQPDFLDAYAAVDPSVSGAWNPYFRPDGNPNGHHSEAWAEGFHGWTKARNGTPREQARSIARSLLDKPPTGAQVDAHMGLATYYANLPRR